MHGEYKPLGGKLVVVDFTVNGGCLRKVTVAGDFFLYPDDILERWRAVLEGAPANSSRAAFAARLAAALAPTDELLGVDPEAVAIALERGLDA